MYDREGQLSMVSISYWIGTKRARHDVPGFELPSESQRTNRDNFVRRPGDVKEHYRED